MDKEIKRRLRKLGSEASRFVRNQGKGNKVKKEKQNLARGICACHETHMINGEEGIQ